MQRFLLVINNSIFLLYHYNLVKEALIYDNFQNQFWAHYTGQSNTTTESDNPIALIMGIVFGVLGFAIVLILVYVLWKKHTGELDQKIQENSEPYTPYPMLSYYSRRQGSYVTILKVSISVVSLRGGRRGQPAPGVTSLG